mmetsp:Transcript_21600/g.50410  ORF Transcript_21600/g.50410 Transcript_21600/m.50410 type:complete len:225 (+) Transcript_21600:1054-1728(+)
MSAAGVTSSATTAGAAVAREDTSIKATLLSLAGSSLSGGDKSLWRSSAAVAARGGESPCASSLVTAAARGLEAGSLVDACGVVGAGMGMGKSENCGGTGVKTMPAGTAQCPPTAMKGMVGVGLNITGTGCGMGGGGGAIGQTGGVPWESGSPLAKSALRCSLSTSWPTLAALRLASKASASCSSLMLCAKRHAEPTTQPPSRKKLQNFVLRTRLSSRNSSFLCA